MGAQHIHRAVKRRGGIVLPNLLHDLLKLRRVAALQILQRTHPKGIIHQPMGLPAQQIPPPLVIGNLVAAVLPHLAQQKAVRLLVRHHRADLLNKHVRQLVRHIQPPRIGARPEPAPDNRLLTLNNILDIRRVHLSDRRKTPDAPPALIAPRPLLKRIPGKIRAVLALGRAQAGIGPLVIKIPAVAAGMVEHTVQHHMHPQRPGPPAQPAEILLCTQHGVHLLIIPGIIPVVAVRLKDRTEVNRRHMEAPQILQLLLDPPQGPAKEIPVGIGHLLLRQLHQLPPVLMDQAVPQHPGGVRRPSRLPPAEPVGKNLVRHALSEPIRRMRRAVIDGLLPGDRLLLALLQNIPVFPQIHILAVLPHQVEIIPAQLRLIGSRKRPGKYRPVRLRPGAGEGDFLLDPGKLLQQHQPARQKVLRDQRAEDDGNFRMTRHGPIGGLAVQAAGIENSVVHSSCISSMILPGMFHVKHAEPYWIRRLAHCPSGRTVKHSRLFHSLSAHQGSRTPSGTRAAPTAVSSEK